MNQQVEFDPILTISWVLMLLQFVCAIAGLRSAYVLERLTRHSNRLFLVCFMGFCFAVVGLVLLTSKVLPELGFSDRTRELIYLYCIGAVAGVIALPFEVRRRNSSNPDTDRE